MFFLVENSKLKKRKLQKTFVLIFAYLYLEGMMYMERAMSVEDKIRKAEEIYYRRKNKEMPVKETTKIQVKPRKNIKLLKKMIKQIITCLFIYAIFYTIIKNNYIFSEDFTQKIKEILSQDINFSEIYSRFFNVIKSTEQITEPVEKENEFNDESSKKETEEQIKEEIQQNEENIGGAEELETTTLSQMEKDAKYIKETISFIRPVNGTISSMFGLRNPTTSTVPKNHTGIDIAAITGTKIISATEGTVLSASSKGDYGKHLKIQINDVVIVYAHCNKLYVNQGDEIKQGQEIAEVGSTGNTTGPHLHFEIRYQERYVDPQLILEL